MKTYLIPIINGRNDNCWSFIEFYNKSDNPSLINISIFNYELGTYIRNSLFEIKKRLKIPKEYFREKCSVYIECDDMIEIIPFMGRESIVSIKDTLVEVDNVPWYGKNSYPINYNYLLTFCGSNGINWLQLNYIQILQKVLFEMYFKFPEKDNNQLILGDCCPININENATGHPAGSHKGHNDFDVDYFNKINKPNSTQYGAYKNIEITNIAERIDNDVEINENVFDWERTWYFVKRIVELNNEMKLSQNISSNNNIRTCKKIRDYIASKLSYDDSVKWYKMIGADDGYNYNHDKHIHFSL